MAEVIIAYKESVPAMRFIAKMYTDEDRVDGMFGAKWGEWYKNNWFSLLEKLGHPDGLVNAHLAYMTYDKNGKFNYWIGLFTPANTIVPNGFGYLDFPAGYLAVCYVSGKEPDIYCKEDMCRDRLESDGFDIDDTGSFERFVYPRFTKPDENGNVILDICYYLKDDTFIQNKIPKVKNEKQKKEIISPYSYKNPIRKIDGITLKMQPTIYLCGQAVIAMLADVSVEEVVEVMKNDRGTGVPLMRETLKYYGLKPATNARQKYTVKTVLPDCCIISMAIPGDLHWSLYYKGKFYDPQFGVLESYPQGKGFKIFYYWEILT